MKAGTQRTIGREVSLDGVGVHSGESATLRFHPAGPGSGIRFRRTDLPGEPEIPATLERVVGTELGTSIGCGEARILTVEHVMAALAAHGIDNARLDLSGPEPPIRDGSFVEYLDVLEAAELVEQDAPRRVLRLTEPVAVCTDRGESYVAAPASELRITASIDFEHPAILRQSGSFTLSDGVFRSEIAPARTFGFLAEAKELRARGLAQGASLENTIVLDDEGVMNDGLRYSDEFLRHKVGDLLGDLALLGARLEGHLVADRPSHRGNVELARKIAAIAGPGAASPTVDVQRIMSHLPHRYPMLLVDRVLEIEAGRRITALKNVTVNEPFFQGHFPGHPIMPGVLILEAMAQAGGLLLLDSVDDPEDKVVYLMSLDKVKFRRPVTPGDQLVCKLELLQFRRNVCRMKGEGYVQGEIVAEAEIKARIVDR